MQPAALHLGNTVGSIIRTKHCVSFIRGWPHRNVQVILRLYRSKGEILIGFDIDACAVGFDGNSVYALPRFRRAVNKRCNLVGVDPSRHSPSYEARLYKYCLRGWAIAQPGVKVGGCVQAEFS
jgi:hypothetical protein